MSSESGDWRLIAYLVGRGQTEADARETLRLLRTSDPAELAMLSEGVGELLDRIGSAINGATEE